MELIIKKIKLAIATTIYSRHIHCSRSLNKSEKYLPVKLQNKMLS